MRYGLKKMNKSKYSIFSKDELVDFLDNYDDRFKSIFSVYRILIQKKIDEKNKELKENLAECTMILEEYQNTDDILKKDKYVQKYRENLNEYEKLNKQLEQLYKKMKMYM